MTGPATERGWRVRGLHHVAFVHAAAADAPGRSAPDALEDLLGLGCAHQEEGPGFLERMAPAGPTGAGFVQLLEPTGPGLVADFLDRRGPGLHHLALEVDDVDRAVADLGARGVRLVDAEPRPGGMGTRIAFVHPSAFHGLLVELVQVPPATAGHRAIDQDVAHRHTEDEERKDRS